jgi:hypothetical protein
MSRVPQQVPHRVLGPLRALPGVPVAR